MKRLRLAVFRSNKHIYGQIIDTEKGQTLAAASDKDLLKESKGTKETKGTKVERAELLGRSLAEKALKKGIKEVIFDRGKFKYHGRVKALAEGAREGGLKF